MKFGRAKAVISLVALISVSVAWGQQPVRTSDGTYDVRTTKEVTSVSKLGYVCLNDIEKANGKITYMDDHVCSCVVYTLVNLLSFKEYRDIEKNILYGKDWTDTDAMRKARPQLIEACNWPG